MKHHCAHCWLCSSTRQASGAAGGPLALQLLPKAVRLSLASGAPLVHFFSSI